jgi:hypothetical protein
MISFLKSSVWQFYKRLSSLRFLHRAAIRILGPKCLLHCQGDLNLAQSAFNAIAVINSIALIAYIAKTQHCVPPLYITIQPITSVQIKA